MTSPESRFDVSYQGSLVSINTLLSGVPRPDLLANQVSAGDGQEVGGNRHFPSAQAGESCRAGPIKICAWVNARLLPKSYLETLQEKERQSQNRGSA